MFRHQSRPGFTLVELLVVIAVVALLVAMLMPSLGNARFVARHARCKSNLHQLSIAFDTYTVDNLLWYPHSQEFKYGRYIPMQRTTEASDYIGDLLATYMGFPSGTASKNVLSDDRNPSVRCPQSWADEDQSDSHTESTDHYMVFANTSMSVNSDFEWLDHSPPYAIPRDPKKMLRKLGDAMEIVSYAKRYRILLSDRSKVWGTGANTFSNHARGAFPLGVPQVYNKGESIPNYAFTDGSVRDFRFSMITALRNSVTYRPGNDGVGPDGLIFPPQWAE